ncbi:hypothetical protein IQ235_13240 [Oscillatoriales cyanobacterium LEGE 11467]|uniref:Uncharacterized protein n=1 Tax=Zarconia navalis LEGE 11467 TaxID=1828826 RepID=A0A928VY35_9CYAN|nr:hypothetical protein [Zarconia navalis]MBE9041744.1 hypothetical protein [Zarconia navalis LEGE 11467]
MDTNLDFKSKFWVAPDRTATFKPIAQLSQLAFKTNIRQTDSRITCEIIPNWYQMMIFASGFIAGFGLAIWHFDFLEIPKSSIICLAISFFFVFILGLLQCDRESLEIDRMHFCLERKWMGLTWFRVYGRTAHILKVDVSVRHSAKAKTTLVIWEESCKYKFVKKHYFGSRLSDRDRENITARVNLFLKIEKNQRFLLSAQTIA